MERWVKVNVKGGIERQHIVKDELKKQKLIAHGYIPLIEEEQPDFDVVTQGLDMHYKIKDGKMVKYFTVEEKPFEEARQIKAHNTKLKYLLEAENSLDSIVDKTVLDSALVAVKQTLGEVEIAKTNEELRAIK